MAHELFHGCGLTGLLSDIGKVERDRFLYFTGGSLTSRVGLRWLWFLAFSLGALQALPDGLVLWPRLSQCEIGKETVGIRLEYNGDGSGRPTHKDITLTGMAAVHRRRAGELVPSIHGRTTEGHCAKPVMVTTTTEAFKVASRPQLGGKTLLQGQCFVWVIILLIWTLMLITC